MSEPKPFASLSSGLLARKGAARPAMKPQGFGQMGSGNLEDLGWNDMGFDPPKPAPSERDGDHDAFGEDIVEHPRASHPTGLTPVESPVHSQQAQIAESFADASGDEEDFGEQAQSVEAFEPAPIAEQIAPRVPAAKAPVPEAKVAVSEATAAAPRHVSRPRSAAGSKGKAAFTLRLDPDRHLKLRLSCAVRGRSAQQIVTDALDHLLATMPELDAMAEKANRKG